jgi:hypothetical protein
MSSILKGLNESYFSPSERDQQNAMDTRRRSDLSGERNAGLNEPDELPTTPQQSRNGVYEYNVPTGQEKIAQKLGLELHKGHWFSRIPVQKADFQFGRPQFHEIPSKNVSEAEQDYGPEYQDKVQRLGQMAKQGERKTVWDPVKRVYKTVPVNPPKEQGVAEAEAPLKHHTARVSYRKEGDPHRRYEAIFKTTHNGGKEETEKRAKAAFAAKKKIVYDIVHEQGVAEGSTFPGTLSNREWSKVGRQIKSSQGRDGSVTSPHQRKDWYDPKDPRSSKQQKLDYLKSMKAKQGVAEAATPASVSKVLRLIDRRHPEWFDNYGMGEVEDTVVDMAEMGQFQGMSAEDALALVGQELESLYGQQGVAEAGNKPLEKSRFGTGDTRTPRDIKSQMRGASDEFVKSTADKTTGPFHSKVAKMQGKMAKSELRRREQGVAEGLNEDEYDKYEAGVMDESEAVAKMFTRLARQGRDPLDIIANRFGWGTYELDDLAQEHGFEDSAEWLNSFEQGVAEGDRPGMKDGRPYSDPLRRHPGNDSYMTPEYLIQKYQDELKKIAAGPYKRPKDVAMYQARIAKLQRQQGVTEGSTTTWEVSFDYGPHQSDSVKVKARSAQEAVEKVETAAEKKGRSIMVNWAKPAEQGIAEGVAETMTMDDAMKVLKHYGAGHFKTTSNELYFYKNGKPFSVDLIWNDDANRSVNLSQLNSITRQLKGQGVAEDQRLDPSCWKGYKKQGTKMKGDTRVNNCVPKESAIMKGLVDENRQGDK